MGYLPYQVVQDFVNQQYACRWKEKAHQNLNEKTLQVGSDERLDGMLGGVCVCVFFFFFGFLFYMVLISTSKIDEHWGNDNKLTWAIFQLGLGKYHQPEKNMVRHFEDFWFPKCLPQQSRSQTPLKRPNHHDVLQRFAARNESRGMLGDPAMRWVLAKMCVPLLLIDVNGVINPYKWLYYKRVTGVISPYL